MRRLLLLLVAAAVVGYLLTGVAQVRPGERAVVRRFGRVVAQPAPGLWIGLPYGIDRVDRVPVNFVQRVAVGYDPEADEVNDEMPAGQMLSGDHNLVNVGVAVDFVVGDEVVDYVRNRDRAAPIVARAAEAAVAEWVAGHTVDEVLLTGKFALRTWLVARVQERIAPYRLGVVVQGASVSWLAAPEEVRTDFDRVAIAQASIRTLENAAREEAERLRRQVQAEEVEVGRRADAYAQGQVELARAEAEAFVVRLAQVRRLEVDNPDVRTAIWWAEMGRMLQQMRANGRIELLDDRLGADGLDITQFARPKKKDR